MLIDLLPNTGFPTRADSDKGVCYRQVENLEFAATRRLIVRVPDMAVDANWYTAGLLSCSKHSAQKTHPFGRSLHKAIFMHHSDHRDHDLFNVV